MLVSYKWLKELIHLEVPVAELAETLSTTGIEVEGVYSPCEGLSKIVVGEVRDCQAIPETHLFHCQVDTGDGDLRSIVCGASNVAKGQKVAVALPGARVAGGHKIKKGKIRGVESLGMICSLGELGLASSVIPKEDLDGIFVLPKDAQNGADACPYLDLDDEIMELSITPNRADALSMRGVAYELAAIYDKRLDFPAPIVKETRPSATKPLSISIQTTACSFYQARIIEDVTIAPSPQWLQNRLMNQGIRPINNVVDVTNYILLLYGQPLHAFDMDTFAGQEMVIRNAQEKEVMTTLDGEKRQLTTQDVVVSVADRPVALAGIMGGEDTEISHHTKRIVLEAAVFDGISIRKTSHRLGLRSESSLRFERGINVATVTEALNAATNLIVALSNGVASSELLQAGEVDLAPVKISTSVADVKRVLGVDFSYAAIQDIFRRLDFPIEGDDQLFSVSIPKRRWDLAIPADLFEEIARIYGYHRLPSSLPKDTGTLGGLSFMQQLNRKVREVIEGAGLSEVMTYSLTTSEKATSFCAKPTPLTQLLSPMTEERSSLRQNLIANILDVIH